MRRAIATYTGLVTRCPPGRGRAPVKKAPVMNEAVKWLRHHRAEPTKDANAERKRLRRARARRERIARRNAAVRKRIGAGSARSLDVSRPVSAGDLEAYLYFEDEPGRRAAAKLLTRGEARRIALIIDKTAER